MLLLFLKLLLAHVLTDYALQSDSMAERKNRRMAPAFLPSGASRKPVWPYYLTAHAFLQAGGVALVMNNPWFAVAEFGLHWIIDFAKCESWINFHTDQCLHILCKIAYVAVFALL